MNKNAISNENVNGFRKTLKARKRDCCLQKHHQRTSRNNIATCSAIEGKQQEN